VPDSSSVVRPEVMMEGAVPSALTLDERMVSCSEKLAVNSPVFIEIWLLNCF